MSDVAADFVQRFAAFWRAPRDGDLSRLLDRHVRLTQPLSPTTVGLDAAREYFDRLLTRLPDLRGEIDRWAGDSKGLFIEFRLRTTLAGRVLEWPLVDRFVLREGLATERVSYFDGADLVRQLLRRPRSAWSLLRRPSDLLQ